MPVSHPPGKRRGHRALPAPLALAICLAITVGTAQPRRSAGGPDLSAYPWLYLRDGTPLGAGEQVLELVAVGDVMLGRGVADALPGQSGVDASRSAPTMFRPFADAASWLRAADLTLGNLESVVHAADPGDLEEEGARRPGPYRLRAPTASVPHLRDAGFDVLGLANNHALDFGAATLAETAFLLNAAGIDALGVGPDENVAFRPLVYEVNGLRIAFLAFNAVPDPADCVRDQSEAGGCASETGWTRAGWDRARVTAAIADVRAGSNPAAVVVSVHWGYEYELRPDPAQRDMARALLDAGADLVIGHHPHVVQGTEISVGRFVAYSLGNLVFDQGQEETGQGLALRAFFDARGLRAVQALPVWAGPRPRLMTVDEGRRLLARVAPLNTPQRVGFNCATLRDHADAGCLPIDVPQTPRQGPFLTGAIDLTGDGVPERVRRVGGQVIIHSADGATWQGLPEWRVVDLAMGDPNDDGRWELLLALWKLDAQGVSRSHPFILSYREGEYRVLWGGSAVADPVHEVELGDVDGDGVQELIVLEGMGAGADGVAADRTAVTVWRWHGWGFSLQWRSPPGRYKDLAVLAGTAGVPPTISVALEP